MRTPFRVLIVLVAGISLLGSVSITDVASATTHWPSAITMTFVDHPTPTPDKFKGVVSAIGAPANCVGNRQVKMFKGTNVNAGTQIGPNVASNATGNWFLNINDPNKPQLAVGKMFWAKVLTKTLGNGDICDSATSYTLDSTAPAMHDT